MLKSYKFSGMIILLNFVHDVESYPLICMIIDKVIYLSKMIRFFD